MSFTGCETQHLLEKVAGYETAWAPNHPTGKTICFEMCKVAIAGNHPCNASQHKSSCGVSCALSSIRPSSTHHNGTPTITPTSPSSWTPEQLGNRSSGYPRLCP